MSADLTAQIHQYLTTAPASLFAQQEVQILDHWEGDANLLWRVALPNQEAVIKLFLDAGQARSRRQFEGHQFFAPQGLAPQPLWADRYPHGLSRQLIVYKWIDGEAITPTDPSALWAWAEAIATLHNAPADEVRRFSPHPLNLDFYWRIEQASIAQIEKWLAPTGLALYDRFQEMADATAALVRENLPLWTTASPTLVHGDLAAAHTLIERGRVLLLDWEMFGLGDPALDVARLLQHEAQTLNADQVDTFLDRYLEMSEQPNLGARITLFQRLLAVHNVIYLLVGLQQNSTTSISTHTDMDSEFRAVLPFFQTTLSTAMLHAAAALNLDESTDTQNAVAEFIDWIAENPARS